MNFPLTINTSSVELTEKTGFELAEYLVNNPDAPRFIAMYGDLGVGKTAFVRGFCSKLCADSIVRSPTFALVNDYKCKIAGMRHVYHCDMYRITGEDDLYSIGFYDYQDRRGICLTEWSENIEYALPDEYFSVTIEKCDVESPDLRKISAMLIKR